MFYYETFTSQIFFLTNVKEKHESKYHHISSVDKIKTGKDFKIIKLNKMTFKISYTTLNSAESFNSV